MSSFEYFMKMRLVFRPKPGIITSKAKPRQGRQSGWLAGSLADSHVIDKVVGRILLLSVLWQSVALAMWFGFDVAISAIFCMQTRNKGNFLLVFIVDVISPKICLQLQMYI